VGSSSYEGKASAKVRAKKARNAKGLRVAVLLLGVAAVIGGLVLWLAPALHTMTTVAQNTTTTVIDGAGHKSTTVDKRNTTTTTPGVGSDAMLVAVFTFGVGLLAAASLWDRIQEFTIGGVSFRLAEAAVEDQEIALVDLSVYPEGYLDSITSIAIAKEVWAANSKDLRLARFDLHAGQLWAPTNLSLYMLLLAHRSSVEVVVFSGQEDAEPGRYFGAASVAWLADRVKAEDPDLFAAYRTTESITLTSEADAEQLGSTFWTALGLQDPARVQPTDDRVDRGRLYEFAGEALITRSIEVHFGQALSKQEQLEILAFPLGYVPITNCHGHLEVVVDKRLIAKKMGLSAVDR
jgi:hypothetical protein